MLRLRYPGVKPFTKEEKELFFGRAQDIDRLSKLIRLEQLVVLYGKSGLGKSSLLNAGVIPLLEEEADYRCHTLRFGAYTKYNDSPLQKTYNSLEAEVSKNSLLAGLKLSLWQMLKRYQHDGFGKVLLIFDQFEELFTYPEDQIVTFQHQLADVLYSKVPNEVREWMEKEENRLTDEQKQLILAPLETKILFSIRADRMSLLNRLTDFFPAVLKNCYELNALSRKNAEDAILLPAYHQGTFATPNFDYTDNALDKILDFLTNNGKQQVEGFTLQVICQHAERLVKEQKVATRGNLPVLETRNLGKLQEIYAGYYTQLIQNFGNVKTQQKLRKLIEEELIFEEDRRRISLDEAVLTQRMGYDKATLTKLVDSHLLRAELSSTGGRSYEISHDALVAPILKAKSNRKDSERKKKQKRQLLWLSLVGLLILTSGGLGANYYIEEQNQVMSKTYEELGEALGLSEKELVQLKEKKKGAKEQLKVISEQASIALKMGRKKDSIFQKATEEVKERVTTEAETRKQRKLANIVLEVLDDYEAQLEEVDFNTPRVGNVPPNTKKVGTSTSPGIEEGQESPSFPDSSPSQSESPPNNEGATPTIVIYQVVEEVNEDYENNKMEADSLRQSGEYAEALIIYNELLENQPDDSYLKQQVETCKAAQARKVYENKKMEADNLRQSGKYAEALITYSELLENQPDDPYLKQQVETCKAAQARKVYENKKMEADNFQQSGEYAKALIIYNELLKEQPDDVYLKRQIEICKTAEQTRMAYENKKMEADNLRQSGEYAKALIIYNELLENQPNDPYLKQQIKVCEAEIDKKIPRGTCLCGIFILRPNEYAATVILPAEQGSEEKNKNIFRFGNRRRSRVIIISTDRGEYHWSYNSKEVLGFSRSGVKINLGVAKTREDAMLLILKKRFNCNRIILQ